MNMHGAWYHAMRLSGQGFDAYTREDGLEVRWEMVQRQARRNT